MKADAPACAICRSPLRMRPFQIGECHLPTTLLLYTTSPDDRAAPQTLAFPKIAKSVAPNLWKPRARRLCALCIFLAPRAQSCTNPSQPPLRQNWVRSANRYSIRPILCIHRIPPAIKAARPAIFRAPCTNLPKAQIGQVASYPHNSYKEKVLTANWVRSAKTSINAVPAPPRSAVNLIAGEPWLLLLPKSARSTTL